jgi:hypothetical protein
MPSAQLLAQQALQTGDYGRAIRLLTDAMGSASPATTPFLVTQWLLARQRLLRQQSSLERPAVILLTQASTVAPEVFARARQALAGWCELRVTDVATLDRAGAWWTTTSQARVDALLLLVDHPDAWRCALTARWLWGACVWHAMGSEPQPPLDGLIDASLRELRPDSIQRLWKQRPDRHELRPAPTLQKAATHLLRTIDSQEPARLMQRLLTPSAAGRWTPSQPAVPRRTAAAASAPASAPALAATVLAPVALPDASATVDPLPPARRPAPVSAGPDIDPVARVDGQWKLRDLALGRVADDVAADALQAALRAFAGLHEGFHRRLRDDSTDIASTCHTGLAGWCVVDAAWITDSLLRLRIEPAGADAPRPIELLALQCTPRSREARVVARIPLSESESGHVVDLPLAHVFQPFALLGVDAGGVLRDAAVWPFPSLLRGAPHHAELWLMGDHAAGHEAAVRASGSLLRELAGRPWLEGSLSLGALECDLRRANGTERLLSPPVRHWLADVFGIQTLRVAQPPAEAPKASHDHLVSRCADVKPALEAGRLLAREREVGDGLRLRLPAEAIPSLSLLCSRRLELADDAVGAGSHALVQAASGRPLALVSMPAPGKALLQAQATDEPLAFPLVLGASAAEPARAVRLPLPLAVHLRESRPVPAPFLLAPVPPDSDARPVGIGPREEDSMAAVLPLDDGTDPTPLVESLARQEGLARPLQLVVCTAGKVPEPLRKRLAALFPQRHRLLEGAGATRSAMLNAAVATIDCSHVLLVQPQLLLHDKRCLATLLAIGGLPGIGAAGCVQIREIAIKKGTEVRMSSGGYFPSHIDLVGRAGLVLEEPVSNLVFGRGSWPVVALSSRLMLVNRAVWTLLGGFDAARFPSDGADIDWCLRARAAGHELLCTGAVTASVDDGARTREIVDQHAWQLLPLDRWHHVIAGSTVVRTLSG